MIVILNANVNMILSSLSYTAFTYNINNTNEIIHKQFYYELINKLRK